jgi:nucleotide-binding universal stress UspA family protein
VSNGTIGKILLLVDGSAAGAAAARFAALVAQRAGASVTAFSVARPGEVKSELQNALAEAAAVVGKASVTVETALVEGQLAPEAAAKARGYDLAIFGTTRKRSPDGRRTSFGVWKLAKSIDAPMLLVPEEARPRIGKILLCTGGERYIEKGARFVAALARAAGAEVVLLHILPVAPEIYRAWAPAPRPGATLLEGESRLARQLRAQKSIFEKESVPVTLRIEDSDAIERSIFRVCRELEADLIVVGSSPSRGPVRTSVLGNVTRDVVARTSVPVLIIRSSPAGLLRDLWMILKEG